MNWCKEGYFLNEHCCRFINTAACVLMPSVAVLSREGGCKGGDDKGKAGYAPADQQIEPAGLARV